MSKINFLVGPQEPLLATVKRQKFAWFRHVTRHNSLSKTILQGTLEGGWPRGWQRICCMDNIKEWTFLPLPDYSATVIPICVVPYHQPLCLLSKECGHAIFNMCNDLSTCHAREGQTGTDKCVHKSTRKSGRMPLHHVSTTSWTDSKLLLLDHQQSAISTELWPESVSAWKDSPPEVAALSWDRLGCNQLWQR